MDWPCSAPGQKLALKGHDNGTTEVAWVLSTTIETGSRLTYPRKFCSEIECANPEGSGKGFHFWFWLIMISAKTRSTHISHIIFERYEPYLVVPSYLKHMEPCQNDSLETDPRTNGMICLACMRMLLVPWPGPALHVVNEI